MGGKRPKKEIARSIIVYDETSRWILTSYIVFVTGNTDDQRTKLLFVIIVRVTCTESLTESTMAKWLALK